jgi:hypothetical protein
MYSVPTSRSRANEFEEASKRLGDELKRLDEHCARLKEAGLSDAEIKRVVDPLESFQKKRLRPTSTSKRFCGNVFTRTLEI